MHKPNQFGRGKSAGKRGKGAETARMTLMPYSTQGST